MVRARLLFGSDLVTSREGRVSRNNSIASDTGVDM